ncbi:MAG TPA: hypothetical protein VEZ14_05135 [Dehalococcoidia bacterium]|nr:hypothetical protein [Dehalococcoidia bacterium]
MNSDIRLDEMMKSIDVYGRLAFGAQCVAAMAIVAGPIILITASVWPFYNWDHEHGRAVLAMLGGWALAIAVTAAGIGLGFLAWRWNGDWIMEWYGYAIAFAIAGVANGVLAVLLMATPTPIYLAFTATVGAAFATGAAIANRLGGSRVLDRQLDERNRGQRPIARRR